jgi:uncharacterized phage protein (TIGR02218 family)
MSKTISSELKTHIAGDLTTVCTCWRIARVDGPELFYTNHDVDVVFDGDTYEADEGWVPTGLEAKEDLSVDNMEAVCFLRATKFNEADVAAGLYDYATLDVFIINYEDTSMGVMYLAQGWILGQVQIRDQVAQVEVRSKSQLLQQNVVELYSPGCRAELGDSRCGVVLDSAFTDSGAVTDVTGRSIFTNSAWAVSGASGGSDPYKFGKLTWTTSGSSGGGSNLNDGFSMEVKSFDFDIGEFTLFSAMPYEITVGDTFDVMFGCDKSLATCRDVFDNVVNFRGEPHLPGTDKVFEVHQQAASSNPKGKK